MKLHFCCKFTSVYLGAKNYQNIMQLDKVIAKNKREQFFAPQCTEQNRFYLPNEVKIITKNRKYKWQAIRRANFPLKLAALNIAFNLIYVLTRREKDRNTETIKQQGAGCRCRCNTLLLLTCQRLQ